MTPLVEDLEDQTKYRQTLAISYNDLVQFVLDYLMRKTVLTGFYWSTCLIFLGIAIKVRMNISGYFARADIFLHSIIGLLILPFLSIAVHEFLHIIPYYIFGAKKIRVGVDLKQYLFYVTAHRHVANRRQFVIVAIMPFFIISLSILFLFFQLPALWKWSLSLFLFVHATMCSGDIALLNYYFVNRNKKIFTWDDADKKMAYFYEEL